MTPLLRSVLLAVLVVAPTAAVAQPAPTSETPAAAQKKIKVDFRGNLRDALKKIAEAGGLNLVVTGNLDQDAQVQLSGVTAEEALRTVASAYDLKITQSGSIWTLRPMTEAERGAVAAPAPGPGTGFIPPVPPIPPLPALPSTPDAAEFERTLKQAEKDAERAIEQAQAEADRMIAQAQQSIPSPEELEAIRKRAEAMVEAAEARAEEMIERASEAHERAIEAQERARAHARDRVATGPIVVNEGEVVESAVSYGGGVVVNGEVTGDAVAFGGGITLGPKGVIGGDAVAFGGDIDRAPGARVDGETLAFGGKVLGQVVTKVPVAAAVERRDSETPAIVAALIWFMTLFGIGFIAALLMPQRMKFIEQEIRQNPLRSSLTGLVASLAIVPLSLLLIVTIIGIPVAMALWLLAALAGAVGFAAVAAELGMRLPLFRGRKTQALVLAMGLVLMIALGFIPVLGPLALIFLGLLGFGAIVRTRFGARPKPSGPIDTDLPTGVPV